MTNIIDTDFKARAISRKASSLEDTHCIEFLKGGVEEKERVRIIINTNLKSEHRKEKI